VVLPGRIGFASLAAPYRVFSNQWSFTKASPVGLTTPFLKASGPPLQTKSKQTSAFSLAKSRSKAPPVLPLPFFVTFRPFPQRPHRCDLTSTLGGSSSVFFCGLFSLLSVSFWSSPAAFSIIYSIFFSASFLRDPFSPDCPTRSDLSL